MTTETIFRRGKTSPSLGGIHKFYQRTNSYFPEQLTALNEKDTNSLIGKCAKCREELFADGKD